MDEMRALGQDRARWLPPAPGPGALAGTAGLVVLAGLAAGLLPQTLLPGPAVPLVFLVAVLVAAVAQGFWAGLWAALLAFAVLNFLFTQPLYTFHVARAEDLVALVEFLLVAGLAGLLAGRLHDRAEAARTRAEAFGVLADLSQALAEAEDRDAVLAATCAAAGRLGRGRAAILYPDDRPWPPETVLDPATLAAAERCRRSGQAQAAALPGWEGAELTLLPLGGGTLLAHAPPEGPEAPLRALGLAALHRQATQALQRLDLAARARDERLRAEAEAARSAVLASLGHDLRTPLATILGAASSLRDLDLPAPARADLLAAIVEEAGRLNTHVTNLVQLSRLELGAPPRRVWVDLNDSAEAAVARARRAHPGAEVVLAPGALPMIQSEGGLIEQALFNLIENALTHGRAPVRIATAARPGAVRLVLSDAGPGLTPDLAAWLAGPDLRPAAGQRGLGLAVAKGIARHLGGDLTWDGAFTLTLPEAP